jgi:hypothetical protein
LLATSVGSGVGQVILRALRRVDAPWYVVGANSEAFSAGVFDCDSAWLVPPVADRAAFEARLIEIVEAERPALVLSGRDDDLPILAAMRERLAELGAFALVGSPEAVDICNDKYRTAKVFRAAGLPFTETAASREEIEALLAAFCARPLPEASEGALPQGEGWSRATVSSRDTSLHWSSTVCLEVKPVGEPDAGNPHVRFDEREGEMGRCRTA